VSLTLTDPPRLILAALAGEAIPLARRLALEPEAPGTWAGQVAGQPVRLVVSGMGPDRITRALAAACAETPRPPRTLWLVGVAGGLDPALEAGACVEARSVLNPAGTGFLLDRAAPPRRLAGDRPPPEPCLLSTPEPLWTPAEKAAWRRQCGAQIVDMEGFALAEEAARLEYPLRILRCVSDTANESLPRRAGTWVRGDGTPDLRRAATDLLLGPWRLPATLRLARRFRRATRRLAGEAAAELTGAARDGQ